MEVSGQLHALAALLPRKAPATHWIGGWEGPRIGQDAWKSLVPPGLFNSDPVAVQPLGSRLGPPCYEGMLTTTPQGC
jgi:hypothetical protein